MKIAISGHRPNKLNNDYDLTSPLVKAIRERIIHKISLYLSNPITKGNVTLITGMALGIDTLFAQIAIELDIPFIAIIPFKGQENVWRKESKLVYYNILRKADKIWIVDESRYAEAKEWNSYIQIPLSKIAAVNLMDLRNRCVVDNCDILIAVWDGTSGGTANCIKYARSIGKEPTIINPKELVI